MRKRNRKHTGRRCLALLLSVLTLFQSIDLSGIPGLIPVYGAEAGNTKEEQTTQTSGVAEAGQTTQTSDTAEEAQTLQGSDVTEEIQTLQGSDMEEETQTLQSSDAAEENQPHQWGPEDKPLSYEGGIYKGNLTISTSSYLTEDLIVEGNLSLHQNLYLNGHTLTIRGTFEHYYGALEVAGSMEVEQGFTSYGGTVCFEEGTLQCDDFLYLKSGQPVIRMGHESDRLCVMGSIYINSGIECQLDMQKGSLELKGDYLEMQSSQNGEGKFLGKGIQAGEEFLLVLSGEGSQMLDIESEDSCIPNIEMQGEEPRRLYLAKRNTIVNYNEELCEIYEGVYRLIQEHYDFERKEHTRGGNYYYDIVYLESGDFESHSDYMSVYGDFYQNGNVTVKDYLWRVYGNYGVQSLMKEDGEIVTAPSEGSLHITSGNYLNVYGDFTMESRQDQSGMLERGGLNLYGSLYQRGEGISNFVPEKGFRIGFFENQDGKTNRIDFQDTEHNWLSALYGDVPVDLQSEVRLTEDCYVTMTGVAQVSSEDFLRLTIPSATLHVKGDVQLQRDFTYGSVGLIMDGAVDLNGHRLLCSSLTFPDNSNGYLIMENPASRLEVYGDFYTGSLHVCDSMNQGTMSVCGNLTQKNNGTPDNLVTGEGLQLYLMGGAGIQEVSFDSSESQIYNLEIRNGVNGYVRFLTDVNIVNFIDTGHTLLRPAEGTVGYTLTEDTVIDGNLWLVDGCLDLNGYNLTVKGNVYAEAGTIAVQNGHLLVDGDLRLQGWREVNGEDDFYTGSGVLTMGEEGCITIGGSLFEQYNNGLLRTIPTGRLELAGNLYSYSDSFSLGVNSTLILNGSTKQQIESQKGTLGIGRLDIQNAKGVQFNGTVQVNTALSDSGCPKEGILQVRELGVLPAEYNGDILVPYSNSYLNDGKLLQDTMVHGTVNLGNYSSLNGFLLKADQVEVNKQLSISGGSLVCDTLYMNAAVCMYDEADMVDVRDLYVNLSSKDTGMKDGVLYIRGSFVEETKNTYSFHPTENHKTVLCLADDQEGTPAIRFNIPASRFHILQLEQNLSEYACSRTPYTIADTIIGAYGDTEPPAEPENLNASDITYSSIALSWDAASDNDQILQYNIFQDGELLGSTDQCSYRVNNLVQNQTCIFQVEAVDVSGNQSVPAELVVTTRKDVTPPGEVRGFRNTAELTAARVPLTWNASTDDGSQVHYNLYRDGVLLQEVTGTSYVDTAVTAGEIYTYSIEAEDQAGNVSGLTTLEVAAVDPPSKLTVRASSSQGAITLTWSGDDRNVQRYMIEIYQGNKQICFDWLFPNADHTYSYTRAIGGGSGNYVCKVTPQSRYGQSGPVTSLSVQKQADLESPVIESIITSMKLSAMNESNRIKVIAVDNCAVQDIQIAYAEEGSDAWTELSSRLMTEGNGDKKWYKEVIWDPAGLQGYYTLRITVTDTNQNTTVETKAVAVNCEGVGSVVITETVPGYSDLQLTWSCEEAEQVKQYQIEIVEDGKVCLSGTTVNTSYKLTALYPDRDYTIRVVPYGKDGTRGLASEAVTVHTLPDTECPVITALMPSGYYAGTEISLMVTAGDDIAPDRCEIYSSRDGMEWEKLDTKAISGIAVTKKYSYRINTADLEEGSYYIRAVVYDYCGNASEEVIQEFEIDHTPPLAPAGLTGILSRGNAVISWEAADEEHVAYYEVYRRTEGSDQASRMGQVSGTSYSDAKIAPEYRYQYYVKTVDQAGNRSEASESFTISTYEDVEPPAAPENLCCNGRTGSSVQLVWTPSTDNIRLEEYRIYRNGKQIASSKEVNYNDTSLTAGTFYTYTVTAVDWKGNESALSNEMTTSPVLVKIENIQPAEYATLGADVVQISFQWICYEYGGGYREIVEYSNDGIGWSVLEDVRKAGTSIANKSTVTWDLKDLTDGAYQVRIRVIDPEQNEASVTRTYYVDREPAAPVRDLHVTEEQQAVYLYWDKSISADLAGYELYRRVSGEDTWTLLADVDQNITTYTDRTVSEAFQYQYSILAYDTYHQGGERTESEWIQVSQDVTAPEIVSLLPQNQVLSGAAVLTVQAQDNRSVDQIWGEYYDAAMGSWIHIDTVEAEEGTGLLTWDTKGLHGRYKVRILANDHAGNTTKQPYEQYFDVDNRGIEKIQNLQGNAIMNSIILTWDEVKEDDFSHFVIEQLTGEAYEEIGTSEVTLGYQIDDLDMETTYTFRVVGYDLAGNRGEASDPVTVVTGTDTLAPTVGGIRTADGNVRYHDRLPLRIMASDNVGLQRVTLEYSMDGVTWQLLESFDAEGKKSLYQDWGFLLADIPDGILYIRGLAEDTSGNRNDENQYVAEFLVDHTPPEQVSGVRWEEENGIPVLSWNPTADSDVARYQIRIQDASGIITEETCTALYFEHRKADAGEVYTYQVCAVDRAGNVGAFSNMVTGIRSEDDQLPRIHSLSPSGDQPVSGMVKLSAMTEDNTAIREVSFYYLEAASGEEQYHLIETVAVKKQNGTVTCQWDTTACTDGNYRIRVQATDLAGNQSQWYTTDYRIDNTPPERGVLLGVPGNCCCKLEWSVPEEGTEPVTCALYRRTAEKTEFQMIYQGTGKSYTDRNVKPEQTYGYKLRTIDAAGNYTDTYVSYVRPNDTDDIAPNAFITADSVTVEGYEIVLDGIQSSDNRGIQSFHWDFGDGTEGTGARVKHIYEKKGTYTVTLTVTDQAGNTGTDIAAVKVLQNGTTGSLMITVVDTSGKLLPNTCVYAHTSDEENDSFITDEYGQCRILAEPGTYKIALFKNGYVAKEEEVTIHLFEEKAKTFVLSVGDSVSGELKVRELTFDEIVAAGIDISAPENQHVFIIESVMIFEEQERVYRDIYNNAGDCLSGSGEGSGGSEGSGDNPVIIVPSLENKNEEEDKEDKKEEDTLPSVIQLKVRQQITWLKEMYEAKLVIYNNAGSSNLTFENNIVELQLPEGISLAKTATPQSLSQNMETVRGGQNQRTIWYLKGDTPGTYQIRAAFDGIFMPFNKPISARFASNAFKVDGGKGLVLIISPEMTGEMGELYYVYYTLKNEGTSEFYNVRTTFGDAPSRRYYRVNTETNAALPLMSSGDYIAVPCLAPGQSISGCYKTLTPLEPHGDPYQYYLELVETQINILKGENLGVKVRVSPVASHLDIPNVIYREIDPAQLAADPVDTWSGAYLEERELLSMGEDHSFNLTMQYNSRHTEECGEFGYGWVHNYESRLVDMQDGTLRYYTAPNAYYTFMTDRLEEQEPWSIDEEGYYVLDPSKLKAEQTYTCYSNSDLKLERTADYTYILKDALGTTYTFSQEGNMTSLTNIEGRSIYIQRDAGQVVITDAVSGRSFTCNLNERGLVASVLDSAGSCAHFYYDDQNRLTVYENAVGERLYYTYDDNNRILTASYSNGTAYVTNTYESKD